MSDPVEITTESSDNSDETGLLAAEDNSITRVALFIDTQNDFFPASTTRKQGSLAVTGATDALLHALRYLTLNTPTDIIVCQDTHTHTNIGHPSYWIDEDGNHPLPHTVITAKEIEAEQWLPLWSKLHSYALKYATRVERQRNHPIKIWPYHAIEHTKGHEVVEEVQSFITEWTKRHGKAATYIQKGRNSHTEFYSVFRAEVPIKSDPSTELNQALIDQLLTYDKIVLIGQTPALEQSLKDLIEHIPTDRHQDIVLLANANEQLVAYANDEGVTVVK